MRRTCSRCGKRGEDREFYTVHESRSTDHYCCELVACFRRAERQQAAIEMRRGGTDTPA